jgi:hypothetical protein
MEAIWTWFKTNWKSNVIATIAIVYSASQFVQAVEAWEAHQPANWRAAIISLLVAAAAYVAKDSTTHSTQTQVQQATVKEANK